MWSQIKSIFNNLSKPFFQKELEKYDSWQAFDELRSDSKNLGRDASPDSMDLALEMLREGRKYYWSLHYDTLSEELKSMIDDS